MLALISFIYALSMPVFAGTIATTPLITYWDDSNQFIKSNPNLLNGQLHGEQKWFFPNGNTAAILEFEMDILSGEQSYFKYTPQRSTTQKPTITTNFNNGIPNGMQSTGNTYIHYDNGEVTEMSFISTNQIKTQSLPEFISSINRSSLALITKGSILYLNDNSKYHSLNYLPDYYQCEKVIFHPYCIHVNLSANSAPITPQPQTQIAHQVNFKYYDSLNHAYPEYTQDIYHDLGWLSFNWILNAWSNAKVWWYALNKDIYTRTRLKAGAKHGLQITFLKNGNTKSITSYHFNSPESSITYNNPQNPDFILYNSDSTTKVSSANSIHALAGLEEYILNNGTASPDAFSELSGNGIKYTWHHNGVMRSETNHKKFLYQGISRTWSASSILESNTFYSTPIPYQSTDLPSFYPVIKPTFKNRYLYNPSGQATIIMEN